MGIVSALTGVSGSDERVSITGVVRNVIERCWENTKRLRKAMTVNTVDVDGEYGGFTAVAS